MAKRFVGCPSLRRRRRATLSAEAEVAEGQTRPT
jgi:hypothetical protein